jgi:hypothetical protein
MNSSQSLTCAGTSSCRDDFVAPVRIVAARPSPAGFLLGAGLAALFVFGLAGGTLFLSRSFVDQAAAPVGPMGFGRLNPPVLSLDIGREVGSGGTVG